MRLVLSLFLLPLALGLRACDEDESLSHPVLCSKVEQVLLNPEAASAELHSWAKQHNVLIGSGLNPTLTSVKRQRRLGAASEGIPVVMAHGMGDSCFNEGMQHVVGHISELLGGSYATCIPTGDTQSEDTTNGYFLNMDASVDIFAQKVKDDPKLQNGFQAMGFSQGNNVIRGYIAKYNDPPVKTFISVNGVNGGEGAVPYCRPSSLLESPVEFSMCDLLMEQASNAAYTTYAQGHSFQANYWRDPRESEFPTYQKYAQLAAWNNEGVGGVNQTLKDNWAKTEGFVWVLATSDAMVWPKEGEQWGAPDPKDPFQTILAREDTTWYQDDLFGLRTAEEAGKNHYESFDGDHLQFDWDDFDSWVKKYFV
jgi:palmitoyl-protein thioesterase